ncbi:MULTISPECIES: GbsR/MarR family transcriptional regulator [Amniculibacterium]|jgi:DNA-binding transcriptional regulator GbsR (MarR family)|uniref:GbsR/MarR family transcriptional regulator n=1 Tax=Amniculibacterium TaxID=2715289 RepID=UPI000F5A5CF4|nr:MULTISPECIES: transcriptional regulator [Amniculibacterium]
MKFSFEIDTEILQNLAKFYGSLFGLPPLAAKIYACLIFDFEKKGVSFDELVEFFSASKSSVSTNLSLLIHSKLIKDIAKIDQRKRFFIFNDDYIKFRFEKIVSMMNEELRILNDVSRFKKIEPQPESKFEIYKTLLKGNIQNIQETLEKL